MHWILSTSRRMKKKRMGKSHVKAIMIVIIIEDQTVLPRGPDQAPSASEEEKV
jgi:hypothetical protein